MVQWGTDLGVFDFAAETAGQQIVRELTEKYMKELNQTLLVKAKQEYL
jgi:hypothetical protein